MIGRSGERSVIDGLLSSARAGRAGVVEVRGEPGSGKTELCDYAVRQAADMTVIRALGMEFESELPLAAVFELLRPLRHHVEQLPTAQRLAARALLDGDGQPGDDRFALAAATLSLLASEAEHHAVLVVVDDAHCGLSRCRAHRGERPMASSGP